MSAAKNTPAKIPTRSGQPIRFFSLFCLRRIRAPVQALPGDEKASAMSMLHSFYCWGHVTVVLLSTLYFVTIGLSRWYYLPLIWAVLPFFNTFFYAKVPLLTLTEEHSVMPLRKLFSMKIFWLFLILMICSAASEQAMAQWASLFAESGLNVSKTMGDLLGPCAFAVCMGLSRTFYGKKGSGIDLKKFILASSILCMISYLLATLSPVPLLSLADRKSTRLNSSHRL